MPYNREAASPDILSQSMGQGVAIVEPAEKLVVVHRQPLQQDGPRDGPCRHDRGERTFNLDPKWCELSNHN